MILMIIGFFWFFAFTLIYDAFKTREDFKVTSGTVKEEGNTTISGNRRNITSHVYYFRLSNHKQPLGVSVNNQGTQFLIKISKVFKLEIISR